MALPDSAKEALKVHVRAHNNLAKRPKIPEEQAFSNIHDASTATAISWLKAHDDGGEKEKGKVLFQIGIEKVTAGGLGEHDVGDLAGGHYYLSSDEPLWLQPADEGLSAAEGAGKVWKGVIKGKIYAVRTVTGGASLALEWKLERETLKSFRHEHLVQLLFSMQRGDTVYMIFDPYSPTSLSRALDPRVSLIDLKAYPGWLENTFCCLLSGLRFLHSKNIKQFDLKPQNIIIDHSISPPNLLFSDFGPPGRFSIASVPDLSDPDPGSWYEAPEQPKKRPANVFSLAVIFLEIMVYMRMKTKKISPYEILSDPRVFGRKGAGNMCERDINEVVGIVVDGAHTWFVEVAEVVKSMLTYEHTKRLSAKQAHLRMVHIGGEGTVVQIHCTEEVSDGSDGSWEDGDGDEMVEGEVEAGLGIFEQFLRETQKAALPTEVCTPEFPQKGQGEPKSPAPSQSSPFPNLAGPEHIAWADPSGLSGTPRKRTLEDTEQEETDGGEEGSKAKKVKVYI